MTPSLSAHLTAICAGAVTRTNVIGLRKAVMATERAFQWGGSWARKAHPSRADIHDVDVALRNHCPRVTGELHDGGVKVLRNPRYAKRWTPAQAAIIASPDLAFYLARLDIVRGEYGFVCVPVYRVFADGPASFYFRNIAWQSGGNGPEIVEGF